MTVTLARGAAVERSWRLSRKSDGLDGVKRYIELYGDFCHSTCREATAMAAWELAENVVKYGLDDEGGAAGTITIALAPNVTFIRTVNIVESVRISDDAIETIGRLSSAASVTELYRRRMLELFENAGQSRARLGLLRVAFEGGFQLSCHYEAPFLELAAHRRCEKTP